MIDNISIVILAAGKGTRLKLKFPKPLAPLERKTLVDYVVEATNGLGDISLVIGHQGQLLKDHFKESNFKYVNQEEQLGTGHAVKTYFDQTPSASDYKYTMIACADTPLITTEVLEELINEIKDNDLDAIAATFSDKDPAGYGRIVRGDKGFKIVEQKDANAQELLINEVNAGLYVFKTEYLKEHIYNLKSENKANEFYLTDTFAIEANVKAKLYDEKDYFLGVNDLYQLSVADRKLRNRNIRNLMVEGVRFIDPFHSYVYSKDIKEGTVIYPNVHIDSSSIIGKDVIIEPGCIIKNSVVEDGVTLKAYTYITDSKVSKKAKIGPMAQLRPGSEIGEGSKLGNFVEVKKSKIAKNSSISHLSYVGDAEIGSDVNIGCGFITCNYDGANKHKTIINDGAFIGSDCQMIAPIEVGREAYVGSGSTINKSIPDGAFAIARARQDTKENMAKRFIKKKIPKSS